MEEIVKFDSVEDYIIELRGEKVILDCNVAVLYGVETREINQARQATQLAKKLKRKLSK